MANGRDVGPACNCFGRYAASRALYLQSSPTHVPSQSGASWTCRTFVVHIATLVLRNAFRATTRAAAQDALAPRKARCLAPGGPFSSLYPASRVTRAGRCPGRSCQGNSWRPIASYGFIHESRSLCRDHKSKSICCVSVLAIISSRSRFRGSNVTFSPGSPTWHVGQSSIGNASYVTRPQWLQLCA